MKHALLPPNHAVKIDGLMVSLQPISIMEVNERYLGWLNNPRINQFIETVGNNHQTIEDVFGYINSLRATAAGELFAIHSRMENLHVGNISVTRLDRVQGIAGYGIMVGDEDAQIKGLGGEASALIIEYYFRDPQIRKIQGSAVSENPRAWQLMESLGYRREGIFREDWVSASGEICDRYQYGLLRREWAQNFKVKLILKHMEITPFASA